MSPARRGSLAATFLASAAVAWAPLVHGPGYEHALVTGIFLPTVAATTAARLALGGADARGLFVTYLEILGAIVAGALTPWLRFGACAPLDDLAYELMTVGLGLALAVLWGVHAAHLRPDRGALAIAAAAPLLSLATSVAIFFGTPTVHAFDAFAGYFAGPLYDTVLRLDGPFAVHRALVAGACLVSLLGASTLVPLTRREPAAWAALVCMSAIAPIGFRFGTWVTDVRLEELLPQRAEAGDCIVHASGSIPPEAVLRLARDAAEQRGAIERSLGAEYPGLIDVFVFRDGAEKARLVGAADTLVAKPWRGEVYVQGTSYPHPVLGHELVHVIAGALTQGPLRIPGRVGGLVANPGLVEGMAVATAPHEDALTERTWAAAMLERGLLPGSDELFGLAFLGGNAGRSYIAAGAFVAFARERFGGATVRAWYGGEDLGSLTARTWPTLDDEFRGWLREEPVSANASRVAAARFGAPGIAGRTCPHVVDGALADAQACRRERRPHEARANVERARLLDPRSPAVRLAVASLEEPKDRLLAYRALAGDELMGATGRDEAATREADFEWTEGRGREASARYAAILEHTVEESRRRVLEVKQAFAQDRSTPDAVRGWLTRGVDRDDADAEVFVFATALEAWREPGEPAIRTAFRAQQAFLRDACREGVREAEAVEFAALPGAMARAMVRGRLVCACLSGDVARVDRVRADVDASVFATTPGLQRAWRAFADRCTEGNRQRQRETP